MSDIIIIEGARGTGKSTVAHKLRQTVNYSTLINFTGFPEEGDKGLEKTYRYYYNWKNFFKTMINHDSTFIFDRSFFSEMVYSKLYKDYDFSIPYNGLMKDLHNTGNNIHVLFFVIKDEEELKKRLVRDKVPFGKAEESIEQTARQQKAYYEMFLKFELYLQEEGIDNIKFNIVDTTGKEIEQLQEEVKKIIGRW